MNYNQNNPKRKRRRVAVSCAFLVWILIGIPVDSGESVFQYITSFVIPLFTYEKEYGNADPAYVGGYDVPDWFYEDEGDVPVNADLAVEESPESVHTMKSEASKSLIIFFSNGVMEGCSFWFPSKTEKERGMPSASINSPIWTIGLGLCSFETPYFRKLSSCSISK